jgi:hypothetical protein
VPELPEDCSRSVCRVWAIGCVGWLLTDELANRSERKEWNWGIVGLGLGIRFRRTDRYGASGSKEFWFAETANRSVNRERDDRGFGAMKNRSGPRL